MPSTADWQSAFSICAALIGAGFASGREIVSFFSGFGAASWLGVAAASAGFSLLVYVVMLLAARTHASTLPGLYGTLMGRPCQDALHMLHGLMCLMTASAMLAAGAELGALTFPIHFSRATGYLLTLAAGVGVVCSGFRSLALLGALLIPLAAVYFGCMALDASPHAAFSAEGLLASVPMGLIYASFNAALCGSTVCLCGQRSASPRKTAVLTGTLLFLLLSLANAAMLSAGETVRSSALPSVLLAARWGVAGYYMSIAILWLSILTTLCAMLYSLTAQLKEAHIGGAPALLISAFSAVLMSSVGFHMIVDLIYPLLGWLCSFVLVALLLFLPENGASSE